MRDDGRNMLKAQGSKLKVVEKLSRRKRDEGRGVAERLDGCVIGLR